MRSSAETDQESQVSEHSRGIGPPHRPSARRREGRGEEEMPQKEQHKIEADVSNTALLKTIAQKLIPGSK